MSVFILSTTQLPYDTVTLHHIPTLGTESSTPYGVGNTVDSPGNTPSPRTWETPHTSQSDTKFNHHQQKYRPLQHPEVHHTSTRVNNKFFDKFLNTPPTTGNEDAPPPSPSLSPITLPSYSSVSINLSRESLTMGDNLENIVSCSCRTGERALITAKIQKVTRQRKIGN